MNGAKPMPIYKLRGNDITIKYLRRNRDWFVLALVSVQSRHEARHINKLIELIETTRCLQLMPRGKRKSLFGRRIKGGKQKQSRYDYAAARESIGLPSANSQQITSAALSSDGNPTPSARSPPKKVVKALLKSEKLRSSQLESHNNKLQMGLLSEQRKNASLKEANRCLADALRQEKKKSRQAIVNLMEEVEAVMMEATKAKKDLQLKQTELDETKQTAAETVVLQRKICQDEISDEKERSKAKVRAERHRVLEVRETERQKAQTLLDKEKRKLEAEITEVAGTLDKERELHEKAKQNVTELLAKVKTAGQDSVRQERHHHSAHMSLGKFMCLPLHNCWSLRTYHVLFFKVHMQSKSKINNVKSILHDTIEQHTKDKQQWKLRLAQAKEQVVDEAEKWRINLNKLEEELSAANDRVYNQKIKHRDIVQKQIDNATLNQQRLQNYIDSLEESNEELSRELQLALSGKRASERQTAKARKIAADRLQKWHDERNKRKEAQDLAAKVEKAARDAEKLILEYKETTQDTRRQMQKEWADEDAAARRGGGRRWPIWVVQLICELLVNGTAPSSIPSNIETMYETLYGINQKKCRQLTSCGVAVWLWR
jgi:hypothetical protein